MERSNGGRSTVANSMTSHNSSDFDQSYDIPPEDQHFEYLERDQSFPPPEMSPQIEIQQSPKMTARKMREEITKTYNQQRLTLQMNFERQGAGLNISNRVGTNKDQNVQIAQPHEVADESQNIRTQRMNRLIKINNCYTLASSRLVSVPKWSILMGQLKLNQKQMKDKLERYTKVMQFQDEFNKSNVTLHTSLRHLKIQCQKFSELGENQIYAIFRLYLFLRSKNFFNRQLAVSNSLLAVIPSLSKQWVGVHLQKQFQRMTQRQKYQLQQQLNQLDKEFIKWRENDQSLQAFDFEIWLEDFKGYFCPQLIFSKHDQIEVHRMVVTLLCKYLPNCSNFIAVLFLAKVKRYSPEIFQRISKEFLMQRRVSKEDLQIVDQLSKQALKPLAPFK